MNCEHCGTRMAEDGEFVYRGHRLCVECASELSSWLLDGGTVENPEQFEDIFGSGQVAAWL